MTDTAGHAPVIVIMGVTGSGKTTIGGLLAERLHLPFYDADDFHTPTSKEKLATDIPLDDADRKPWLDALSTHMKSWSETTGAVLACSALKHEYRSTFRAAAPGVKFVFLDGNPQLIAERIAERSRWENHIVRDFTAILEGQFRDLEIPTSAIRVDIHKTPEQIVEEILHLLQPPLPDNS